MYKQMKKLQLDGPLSKLQDNVQEAIQPLIESQIGDGLLLTNIELISSKTTKVPHKLGRKLLGYLVVDNIANSNVWRDSATSINSLTLDLKCSVDTTISLWVF